MNELVAALVGAVVGAVLGGVVSDAWGHRRRRLTVTAALDAILCEDILRLDRCLQRSSTATDLFLLPLPSAAQVESYDVLPAWMHVHLGQADAAMWVLETDDATRSVTPTSLATHKSRVRADLLRARKALYWFQRSFADYPPFGDDAAPQNVDKIVLPDGMK